jgi:NAD(P)H-flavin reductase
MNGGASDALLAAPEGSEVRISGPLGMGFPLAEAHGRPLVVAVAGSALAVTRPILRERIARREGPSTSIYIGARSIHEVPLAHEVSAWMHAGARVVLCLSRGDERPPGAARELAGARRASGYVQGVFANDIAEGLVSEARVFAAGPRSMLEELRALARPGAIDVHTNA